MPLSKGTISTDWMRHPSNKGVEVIVEGVETVAQHRIIRDLGVNFTQGYWHGKPQSSILFD